MQAHRSQGGFCRPPADGDQAATQSFGCGGCDGTAGPAYIQQSLMQCAGQAGMPGIGDMSHMYAASLGFGGYLPSDPGGTDPGVASPEELLRAFGWRHGAGCGAAWGHSGQVAAYAPLANPGAGL